MSLSWSVALLMLVLPVLALGRAAAPINLARLPGVLAVVDSEHRDRWGTDGYHAANLHDGRPAETEFQAWASDNWEVAHSATLIFPQRVRVERVVLHWWNRLTPRHALLQGWRDGQWQTLAQLETKADRPSSSLRCSPTDVEAIRLVQPVTGANPRADRRLWIAEMEVHGAAGEAKVDADRLAGQIREENAHLRRAEDAARVKPQIDLVMRRPKTRGFRGIIDAQDVQRGRANVARWPWAKEMAAGILKDADWWVRQPDDYLRGLVPAGNPRALCPQFEKGCPIHGGARMGFDATLEAPYRWRCKQGGEWWYDGATVKNPTTGEEITVRDDGSGWLAPAGFPNAGRRYFFVAAYRYFLLGKLFRAPYEPDGGSQYQGDTPITQLALAYAITGDARYGHKAGVLLCRLADLYPTYDGCIEGPTQRQDGYIGQTFERFLVQNLILASDLVWDALDRSQQQHLQRGLLAPIYEYLHRLMPYFDGDFLMYEMTALAALAHVLDSPEIAAETLESDTGLGVLMNNSWFRDGKFIYDSCGYNVGNARTPPLIAEWLQGMVAPPAYPKPLDVYNAPDYHIADLFDFLWRIDCDGRLPQIGDGGGPRTKALQMTPPYDLLDERALVRLPGRRDAILARLQAASGGDLQAFRRGQADWWLLFHAAEAPSAMAASTPPPAKSSELFEDSGIAVLRAGKSPATRQHVSLTFSKGSYGHGHPDKLAIDLLRHGYDLSADLGYPTTWTDVKYPGWETNTASHCTVMLDEKGQHGNAVGQLDFYAALPGVDVVEASAERAAYPAASLYRRTVALVRDDRGEPLYTFDVFRVAGAKTRDYLFQSLGRPEDLTVALDDQNAPWQAQPKGSLAGEDVAPMSSANGYSFLFGLQRARSDGGARATWHSTRGAEQNDNYLLTRRAFRDFTVEFTMTRTGKASGSRDRAFFVFGLDRAAPQNRRAIPLQEDGLPPVGRPVRIKIDVRDGQAALTRDGRVIPVQPQVVGTPLATGSVGFLHYYNYGYDYADFVLTPHDGGPVFRPDLSQPPDARAWHIDATYTAGDGVLHAWDSESVGVVLHMLGAPGREYIRAKAEGFGVRGQSPLEGHFIARDRATDPAAGSAFVSVIETFQEHTQVTAVDALPVAPAADGTPGGRARLDAVAVRVRAGDRVDYLLSALTAAPRTVEADGLRIAFSGRFGLVNTRGGKVVSLSCVGGTLACGAHEVRAPETVHGEIVATDLQSHTLRVRLADVRMQLAAGQRLLVRNAQFVAPAVYTIRKAERVRANLWRLQVDMPFVLARGRVESVDAARGQFASRTPVMKLRVNPGLFDGKRVRPGRGRTAPEFALTTATEQAFRLADAKGLSVFPVGGEYLVVDVGTGDAIEILSGVEKTFQ